MSDQVDKSTVKLLYQLECIVCKNTSKDPVNLNCSHMICNDDVANLVQNNAIECPQCKRVTQVQNSTLPKNNIANLIIENLQAKYEAVNCKECNQVAVAPFYCVNCDAILCGACYETTHIKGPTIVQSHKALPYSPELKSLRVCKDHQEPLRFYCSTDKCLVCALCLTLGQAKHKDHPYITVSDAAANISKEATNAGKLAQQREDEANTAILQIQNVIEELEKANNKSKSDLDDAAKRLVESIERRKLQLNAEREKIVAQKKDSLHRQIEELTAVANNASLIQKFCSQMTNTPDEYKEITDHCKLAGQLTQPDRFDKTILSPCEFAEMTYIFNPKSTEDEVAKWGALAVAPRPSNKPRDLSWMETSDGFKGFKQSEYHPRVYYAVSKSNKWDIKRVYDCPVGYHWASTAEGNAIFGNNKAQSGSKTYAGKGGWTDSATDLTGTSKGCWFNGVQRRFFRFSDSHTTQSLKHVMSDEEQALSPSNSSDSFAGIVCIKD